MAREALMFWAVLAFIFIPIVAGLLVQSLSERISDDHHQS